MKILFVSVLLLLGIKTVGQTDNQLWSINQIILQPKSGFAFELRQDLRWNNNISNLNTYFTEFGTKYNLNKHLSTTGYYRLIGQPENSYKHRISGDLFASTQGLTGSYKLSYRLRIHNDERPNEQFNTIFIRNGFSIGKKIQPYFNPFVSFENFYRLHSEGKIKKFRYDIGTTSMLWKGMFLSLVYRYQKDKNVEITKNSNVFIISLKYKIYSFL